MDAIKNLAAVKEYMGGAPIPQGRRIARVEDIATYNLILQLELLVVIGYGIRWRFKGRLQRHAHIMTFAYTLTILAILLAMVPRFIGGLAQPVSTYTVPDELRWLHVAIGSGTVILGAFLIGRYAKGGLTPGYCRGKRLMLVTDSFWMTTILLGLVIYVLRTTA